MAEGREGPREVEVGGYLSPFSISCGAPKDRVLGSLVFLLFINNMLLNSAILVSHRDKEKIQELLVDEQNRLRTSLFGNGLLLHQDQTESIMFG